MVMYHHILRLIMKINRTLLKKDQLAKLLGLTVRGVEGLVAKRKIPVLRISNRCVRFDVPAVMAALSRFEEQEVGRPK